LLGCNSIIVLAKVPENLIGSGFDSVVWHHDYAFGDNVASAVRRNVRGQPPGWKKALHYDENNRIFLRLPEGANQDTLPFQPF
jgi:hypothetical protein